MKTYTVKIDKHGTKRWYFNDKLHCEHGPAVEYVNGTKEWYFNNRLHCEHGPAFVYADGVKAWFLNGVKLSEAEFIKRTKLKTYKIGVVWQMWGHVDVEANSLDEAIIKAQAGPMPDNGEYVEGSFEVDVEGSSIN
jgi:hypothetical protein